MAEHLSHKCAEIRLALIHTQSRLREIEAVDANTRLKAVYAALNQRAKWLHEQWAHYRCASCDVDGPVRWPVR